MTLIKAIAKTGAKKIKSSLDHKCCSCAKTGYLYCIESGYELAEPEYYCAKCLVKFAEYKYN